ncbi:hypothetical protein TNCV_3349611 [Trichonephila clavipes]|nr:hypothetical protein TNCV_3349611 [Trichonephila clavipes]
MALSGSLPQINLGVQEHGHGTTPLSGKGDIKDISIELDNGGGSCEWFHFRYTSNDDDHDDDDGHDGHGDGDHDGHGDDRGGHDDDDRGDHDDDALAQ